MNYIAKGPIEPDDHSWLDFDPKKCNRCGICIDMCPMDVLRFSDEGLPFMRYRDDCWYCDVCVFVCPRKAITMIDLPYLIR
ncbi:MAG: 4Fe-4S binding protein [Desulfarculaceae bacterium]|jgi:NAD-dependent dihydropyrimidine dehydrogenase PreA subunit